MKTTAKPKPKAKAAKKPAAKVQAKRKRTVTSAETKTLFGQTYQKVHKLKKAADAHEKKIKARGGKVKREKTKQGYNLIYGF